MDDAFTQLAARESKRTAGLVFRGKCDSDMGVSTTTLDIAELSQFGADFFNTHFYAQVIKNANSVGNAPESEVRKVTDYSSSDGVFTVDAFSANVEPSDEILILHESIVALGRNDANNVFDSSNVVGNSDGSYLERLEQLSLDIVVLNAELNQRVVAQVAQATRAVASYADVVNITDKGVLTGVSQVIYNGATGNCEGVVRITIDGVAIMTDSLFSIYVLTPDVSQPNTVSFNHRFDTSLRVEHMTSNTNATIKTTVAYTID